MNTDRFAPTSPSRLRPYWLDLLVLVCLALAAWRLTGSVQTFVDIGLDDESSYLKNGLLIPHHGLPEAAWGPLYCWWYWTLHWFEPDSIRLYYLNYRVLALVTPALIYLAARRFSARPAFALLLAALYLISSAPHLWPRVSHFALIVILIHLLVAAGGRRLSVSLGVMTLGFLLASFCRPEFFVSFLLGVVGLAAQWFRSGRTQTRAVAGFIAAYIFLLGVLGNPLAKGRGPDRSLLAFAQHYTLNLYRRTNNPDNPWTTAGFILQSHFGAPQTLGQAIANNPRAFAQHVWDNLRRTPGVEARLFLVSWRDLIGERPDLWLRRGEFAAVCGGMLGALLILIRKRIDWRAAWARPPTQILLFTVLLSLAATAPSALIIYPREHYLLVFGVLALLPAAVWLTKAWPTERSALTAALAAAVLLATPDYFTGWLGHGRAAAGGQPSLKKIKFIQSLAITRQVTFLDLEGGCETYLGTNFTWVPAYEKRIGESLAEYIRRRGVNLIILTESLANDVRYKSDPEFQQLATQPAALGFAALPIPGLKQTVLVSESLRR